MHSNNTCEQRQKTNGTAIAGVPKYNFRFNGMGLPAIGAEGQPALPKRPAIAQVNPVPQPVRAKSKSKNKFIPATIPAELRKLPQWVCWRWDERNGKTTKVPVNPITGANASSTAPDDWTSFEAAVRAFQDSENYGGVGFVFTESDGFFGVDLDACYDSETKTLALWAAKIVNALDSYTEISPSGFGVKIVARGTLPPISRHVHKPKGVLRYGDKEPEIAIYDRARYWCLTGRRLKTRPETCEPRQAELETLLAELFPQATPQPANRPAVVRSLKPLNSLFERFLNDCAGAKNGQRSERDFALCAAAIREGWDRDEVWERVQHVGKFAEAGRRYFDLTCKSAEATVAADESVKSTTAETSVRSLARELDPRDVVQKYLQGKEYNGIPTIIFWQGSFYLWEHGKYSLVSDTEMRARLVQHINRLATKVTTSITSNHFEQFKAQALTASSIQPLGWLYEPPHDWPATDLVATRTHIVNLSLFTGGKPSSSYLDATPAFFTLNALDYDFSCTPPKPTQWLKFLHELWSTDPAAIETLQEWFGYCLTPDTRQQKMLLLVGPKRSGKGTIARVITELLGRNNVAGPTLSSLGGNFGLSTLLGASLAIISDARLSGKSDQAVIAERLLSITGEDGLTIDVKFKEAVTRKLNTRLMLMTNELPRLSDTSGALAGRMVILRLTESFFGREDTDLTGRLLQELPGILHWAIAGWARLRKRGCFQQPQSGQELAQELSDLTSPVGMFVGECCDVDSKKSASCDLLFKAWRAWCQRTGRDHPGNAQTFGRDLRAVVTHLSVSQIRSGSTRLRFYNGLGVKPGINHALKWTQ